MKFWILLPVCFLLLWTPAEGKAGTDPEIKVKSISDGIELTCTAGNEIQFRQSNYSSPHKVPYQDDNSGEYTCKTNGAKIYVKFRKCENCIELDVASIVGLAIGNVVATIVIGVAVYLIASQGQISPATLEKKRSDRQHLIPNESNHRAPNDHYQPLKHKGGKKDTYDVLTRR